MAERFWLSFVSIDYNGQKNCHASGPRPASDLTVKRSLIWLLKMNLVGSIAASGK